MTIGIGLGLYNDESILFPDQTFTEYNSKITASIIIISGFLAAEQKQTESSYYTDCVVVYYN